MDEINIGKKKPGYYAVIPANVRYDKDLTPLTRLFYGEITCLCNKYGYCTAGNEYFMELYDISESSVKRAIRQLKNKNYITVENESRSRKIYISFTASGSKMNPSKVKNDPQMGVKNEPHNNTSNNNKFNNIYSGSESPESAQVFLQLPLQNGTFFDITDEVIKHYGDIYPGVNIKQEFKKMLDWLNSNPNRRKKKIKSFITNWLNKADVKPYASEYVFTAAENDEEFLKRLEDCNGYY